jgi:hypothetical protein
MSGKALEKDQSWVESALPQRPRNRLVEVGGPAGNQGTGSNSSIFHTSTKLALLRGL